jgi:hypothetical protein
MTQNSFEQFVNGLPDARMPQDNQERTILVAKTIAAWQPEIEREFEAVHESGDVQWNFEFPVVFLRAMVEQMHFPTLIMPIMFTGSESQFITCLAVAFALGRKFEQHKLEFIPAEPKAGETDGT